MNKIAIHYRKGSFSEYWIEYCNQKHIPYKIVDGYADDIISQLRDCTAFMWHHHHAKYKDALVAKKVLFSLDHTNFKVFPDFRTTWHFDDKVAQKYLLESIQAPLVPSFVFYDKEDAVKWAKSTNFPKVFKLKGGAGAANVKLIKSSHEAVRLIRKAFGKGFPQFDKLGNLKERYRKYKEGKDNISGVFKGIARLFITPKFANFWGNEKGYVYFQEFIPNNTHDIRVIIVADKAFAIKRMVRENDFRASGSGNIVYKKEEIDIRCIQIAFEVNKKLRSQSIAFDFVFDEKGNPLIIELSYGFASKAYESCEGYWDANLHWYETSIQPQHWMVESMLVEK